MLSNDHQLGRARVCNAGGVSSSATRTPGDTLIRPSERLISRMWPARPAIWVTATYLALYILRPWEILMPWLGELHFERIYALGMIAVVFLTCKIQPRVNAQSVAVLFFLSALVLSSLFAVESLNTWTETYKYVTLVVFYFILLIVVRTPYELVFLATVYVASVSVYMAKAQWEFFFNGRRDHTMGVVRLIGFEHTFGGPNALAMSIIVSMPIAYFLLSYRKIITETWPKFCRAAFIPLLGGYGMLALSSLVLTNSRSGMLCGMVFIALVTLRNKSLARKLVAAVCAMALLLVLWLMMS